MENGAPDVVAKATRLDEGDDLGDHDRSDDHDDERPERMKMKCGRRVAAQARANRPRHAARGAGDSEESSDRATPRNHVEQDEDAKDARRSCSKDALEHLYVEEQVRDVAVAHHVVLADDRELSDVATFC